MEDSAVEDIIVSTLTPNPMHPHTARRLVGPPLKLLVGRKDTRVGCVDKRKTAIIASGILDPYMIDDELHILKIGDTYRSARYFPEHFDTHGLPAQLNGMYVEDILFEYREVMRTMGSWVTVRDAVEEDLLTVMMMLTKKLDSIPTHSEIAAALNQLDPTNRIHKERLYLFDELGSDEPRPIGKACLLPFIAEAILMGDFDHNADVQLQELPFLRDHFHPLGSRNRMIHDIFDELEGCYAPSLTMIEKRQMILSERSLAPTPKRYGKHVVPKYDPQYARLRSELIAKEYTSEKVLTRLERYFQSFQDDNILEIGDMLMYLPSAISLILKADYPDVFDSYDKRTRHILTRLEDSYQQPGFSFVASELQRLLDTDLLFNATFYNKVFGGLSRHWRHKQDKGGPEVDPFESRAFPFLVDELAGGRRNRTLDIDHPCFSRVLRPRRHTGIQARAPKGAVCPDDDTPGYSENHGCELDDPGWAKGIARSTGQFSMRSMLDTTDNYDGQGDEVEDSDTSDDTVEDFFGQSEDWNDLTDNIDVSEESGQGDEEDEWFQGDDSILPADFDSKYDPAEESGLNTEHGEYSPHKELKTNWGEQHGSVSRNAHGYENGGHFRGIRTIFSEAVRLSTPVQVAAAFIEMLSDSSIRQPYNKYRAYKKKYGSTLPDFE